MFWLGLLCGVIGTLLVLFMICSFYINGLIDDVIEETLEEIKQEENK